MRVYASAVVLAKLEHILAGKYRPLAELPAGAVRPGLLPRQDQDTLH